MRSNNSDNLLKKLGAMVGIAGASTLLGLPAFASTTLQSNTNELNMDHRSVVAQTGTETDSNVNPANPDAEGGEAFEQAPDGQPLPSETPNTESNTTDEGEGGGEGGVDSNNSVNPANPDAEGGEAFEQTPGSQPIPDAQDSNDSSSYDRQNNTTGGSSDDSGIRALW